MITIVDCGVSNLGSIINMIKRIGGKSEIANTTDVVLGAEKLLLPGIGAFDAAVKKLEDLKLAGAIKRKVAEGVPILGICLGMQLLSKGSEEGEQEGLGLINAYCHKFSFSSDSKYKVPHMGWSRLKFKKSHPLIDSLDAKSRFYFVHSYYMKCESEEDVLASCDYGMEFAGMVQRENIFGAQFHPEKSHRYGMGLMQAFLSYEGL